MGKINRSLILGLVILFYAFSLFAQKSGTPAKTDNLYSLALFASVVEMEKAWGNIDDSDNGSRIRTDYHQMFVEKDPEITESLPTHLGDYHFEYLDNRDQIDRYKKLRKEYSILRIRPLQSEGIRLKIQVSVSYFKYKKGKLIFEVSDWSDVDFRYDCEKQKYVVSGVTLGGV